MSTNFFTNQDGNTLYEKFKGIFNNQDIRYFEALVGYFRSSGYFKIRPFLEDVSKVRILVGIEVDKLVKEYHSKGLRYLNNPQDTENAFLNQLIQDVESAEYDREVEEGILQLVEDLISGKVEIRASGKRDLHAKIYIMRPENFNEHNSGSVITGSSNLSKPGLGYQEAPNYEFNVLLERYDDVQFALNEFEQLWEEADTVLPEDFSQTIKTGTHLNDSLTPYELYLKMLIEYFGEAVEQEEIMTDELPKGYMRLQYQMDAVVDGFKTLKDHNGVILADVVGLGKTIIAAQIIKRYIRYNGFNTRVLVIHSPALEQNWRSTLKDFNLTTFVQFITNGSLHKVIDPDEPKYLNPADFDLIVVDESHGFRSDTSDRYALLQLITKTPRSESGGDEDLRKKVILMSATPLNNQPDDIANQIYLFQDARSSSIPNVPNLQTFFAPLINRYKEIKKIQDHKKLVKEVKDIYRPIRDKIMNHLVIRRTRSDIEKIPAYREDMEKQNLKFPEINGPNNIHYLFDDTLTHLFNDSANYLINDNQQGGLGYFRYRAIEFLSKEEHRDRYDNIELISKQLAAIMQNRLVKRLESSFRAFYASLHRLAKSNKLMISMLNNNKVLIAPDLDTDKYFREGRLKELEDRILALRDEAPNNNIYSKKDFTDEFVQGLKNDQAILDELVNRWSAVTEDPKLDKFLQEVDEKINASENQEGKLVIFSESKETVDYVTKALRDYGYEDTLAVYADNQNSRFNTIRYNFDANIPEDEQKEDYNLLVTTEVLSEGINLHRSNYVLNYDIPWNSTRLMQRIGRVNRIGTTADYIYVFNFYPTSHSDELIKLNEKAIKKIQGFHSAFSEDSKIYSEIEELQENILGKKAEELDDTDERLQLLAWLREFRDKHPEFYQRIKKLPVKSRCGREAQNMTYPERFEKPENPKGTLAYLKGSFHEGFYYVEGQRLQELTFLEAERFFRSDQQEKPIELPNQHYGDIAKTLKEFGKQEEAIHEEREYTHENLAVMEKNAVEFLKGIKNLFNNNQYQPPHEFFINYVDTALSLIYMGTFKQFRNQVAKLARAQKQKNYKAKEVLKQLDKLFRNYPIHQIYQMEEARKQEVKERREQARMDKPKIVLSESFEN